MTFVEDLLKMKGMRILNLDGEQIFEMGEERKLMVNKPAIIENLDITLALFNRGNREVKMMSYEELRNFGWVVYQRPIRTEDYDYGHFFPRNQRIYYFPMEADNSKIPKYSTQVLIQPRDLQIRYNIRTRLFRLEGPNTGPNNVGKWQSLDQDRRRLNLGFTRRRKK